MNELEVYLHVGGRKQPELLKVPSNGTVGDIVANVKGFGECDEDEFVIMIEESGDVIAPETLLSEAGVKHRCHVHCNRCPKVEVTVKYNGRDVMDSFPPSTKVKRILKWSVREHNIGDEESADFVLTLENEEELQGRDHIGMFVDYPSCKIVLLLTNIKAVNG